MAARPQPDDTHEPEPGSESEAGSEPEAGPELDGDGLSRRERRLAGKKAKSTVKIPTRGQYGISANHRQYSHRRRG